MAAEMSISVLFKKGQAFPAAETPALFTDRETVSLHVYPNKHLGNQADHKRNRCHAQTDAGHFLKP